jgi:putative transposase
MRRIDELHPKWPFMRNQVEVGRKRMGTLMREIGISALYRESRTGTPPAECVAHRVYRYLFKNLEKGRPNRVLATDITYLPMPRGFKYLMTIMHWASRRVLAWRTSDTFATDFFAEALQEAIARYSTPEIFNTDGVRQFTTLHFSRMPDSQGTRTKER